VVAPSGPWSGNGVAGVHQAVALDALSSLALLDFSKVGLGPLLSTWWRAPPSSVSSSRPRPWHCWAVCPRTRMWWGTSRRTKHLAGNGLSRRGNS